MSDSNHKQLRDRKQAKGGMDNQQDPVHFPKSKSGLHRQPPVSPPPVVRSPPRSDLGQLAGGFFWLAATAMLVLAAWYLGPLAVERFQFAATKGRVSAEYENARDILNGLPLSDISQGFELVAQRIKPSVVSIRSEIESSRGRGTDSGGQGSGVIMSADGYILTNEHVVGDATRVTIGLHDRRQYDGIVVGKDKTSDLAVIKIQADGLLPADWGNSDSLSVGSMVWAVGSPYGLEQTVTSGILSAKERGTYEQQDREYLQTDAAVNPGNSGGPLVDARGEVVGINTSIFGEQFLGISFAIPSTIARFVFDQIIKDGEVTRSYLGVSPQPVFPKDMSRLNLPDLNGAVVAGIPKDGPAFKSDLQVGDVIRSWNGKPIRTHNMLYSLIAMTRPNSMAEVEVWRDGNPLTMQVEVGKRPPEEYFRRRIPNSRERFNPWEGRRRKR